MTLQELLNEARKDIYSENSKKLQRKLTTRLNTSHCYILHRVFLGLDINGSEYQQSRTMMIKKGYIEWFMTGKKAKNNKFLRAYKCTTLGISAHGEMLDAFMPIVKRINNQLQQEL